MWREGPLCQFDPFCRADPPGQPDLPQHGLPGFTAAVISDNEPMLHVFVKLGADIETAIDTGVLELRMTFRG